MKAIELYGERKGDLNELSESNDLIINKKLTNMLVSCLCELSESHIQHIPCDSRSAHGLALSGQGQKLPRLA